jgi:hypothetical protein
MGDIRATQARKWWEINSNPCYNGHYQHWTDRVGKCDLSTTRVLLPPSKEHTSHDTAMLIMSKGNFKVFFKKCAEVESESESPIQYNPIQKYQKNKNMVGFEPRNHRIMVLHRSHSATRACVETT